MPIRVWVWLRGEFLLESFLPLDFSAASSSARETNEESSPSRTTAIEGAHVLVDECHSRRWDRLGEMMVQTRIVEKLAHMKAQIDRLALFVLEWSSVIEDLGLDSALSEAVFRNASGDEEYATLPSLALHMLLVGLEYFTYKPDEATTTRGDVVTVMVHEQMDEFLGVLCRCATGCSRKALKMDRIPFTDQQLKKFLRSLDVLFEGMTEDDETGGHHDEIVKLSQIIEKLWLKDNELSLRKLTSNMRKCLVQDPFQIDDIAVDKPSCSPRRVTSLTNTRRKVTVAGWQRFQLLSKAVYKDVHLRISSNKSESMFVAPWRSRSIVVDNVKGCPAMVLGPTHGAVILRDVHNSNVSVACRQLYLWKCSQVTVFLHSFRPPIVRGCTGVRFAAYNVSYEGLMEEMTAAGLRAIRYNSSKHIINLDDSEVSTLPARDFYIQPVPIVNNESDIKCLLEKLPSSYREQWESTMAELKSSASSSSTSSSSTCSAPSLKKSDLIYLRGKIVSNT